MSEIQTETTPILTITRTFDASLERVFAAFTESRALRDWFGPPGFEVPEADVDLCAGGRYRIVMKAPDGELYTVSGVFSEVRPPERLAYTWRWEEDDPAQERDTHVTIEFRAVGSRTEIVLTHRGFASAESRDRHDEGWSGSLDKLGAYVKEHHG